VTTDRKAWIVGAGAQGRVVLETLRAAGAHSSICFIDDSAALKGTHVNGVEIIGSLDGALASRSEGVEMFVAVGHPIERIRLAAVIVERGGRLGNAIHPSAAIASSATMGSGNFVGAQAVVNTDACVGNHTIINTGAIAEHDSVLEDGTQMAARATLGGRARMEAGSFLSAGVTVASRVRIGRGTVVGAGATVMKDLPEHVLAWGNPARVMEMIPDFDWKRVL
jgi:sugar O-acyltransferase (sialic acid O-acetyltransferase NeuD family)